MHLKPLFLLLSIDLGLLALTITIRFFIYPIYCWSKVKIKEKKNHEIEKTIEIKKEELKVSKQHKLILKK
ncbi:hypothetical protein [uncultured Thomasclavelia sp.]|uniref:hypothetical protein n=1 Tax=uncultured Thomasclavelia sp. TaxID=3025759 RepID=UPI00280B37F1|nr:hypothetical protein [uncultured Thomasclavelia sp.]